MPVYVDALMACTPTARWPFDRSCHMFVEPGDLETLHAFAQSLGIPRSGFQPRLDLPHYDLNVERRIRAVELGAVQVDRRFVVGTLNRWRAMLLQGENERK